MFWIGVWLYGYTPLMLYGYMFDICLVYIWLNVCVYEWIGGFVVSCKGIMDRKYGCGVKMALNGSEFWIK